MEAEAVEDANSKSPAKQLYPAVCVRLYMLNVALIEALHTSVYLLCAEKHAVWHCVKFASRRSVYYDRVLQQRFLCVSLSVPLRVSV